VLKRVLTLLFFVALISESISFFYSAWVLRQFCYGASNWKALSSLDQGQCLSNASSPIWEGLLLGGFALVVERLKGFPVALLWLASLIYGAQGFAKGAPMVLDWTGVVHGDFVSLGAYQYALFVLIGILGLIRVFAARLFR
jgi:hypothetical protein